MKTCEIILCTLNSTYQHCSFGLRYLQANLKEFKSRSQIIEFTIAQDPRDIVERLLRLNPQVVGFGVYIWNCEETLAVLKILRRLRPDLKIILGGPEVSHETESQELFQCCDFVLTGEAEDLLYETLQKIFSGEKIISRKISGPLPNLQSLILPYEEYTDEDIQNRILYVEASRGCPYRCEYCLSSLDRGVRNFPLESFLNSIERLIQRGARQFKFVDRTFNLSPLISSQILQFFLDRISLGLFLHFEMVPDRLPSELRYLIQKFPPGSLQFEIGIQTFNPEVAKLVSRRQDYEKISENFQFLRQNTRVHTHADLIVGLPGESLQSFARGFDQAISLNPDEVQVGLLKRLKGFPLARHDQSAQMIYQEHSPFQVLQTKEMSFEEIQDLTKFSKHWDLIANSGNFPRTLQNWKEFCHNQNMSFFEQFFKLSQFLSSRHPQSHGISLLHLLESLWVFFSVENPFQNPEVSALLLAEDYSQNQRRDLPRFLRESLSTDVIQKFRRAPKVNASGVTPQRQKRHLQASQSEVL